MQFDEEFDDWNLTRMIPVVVTSLEHWALGLELVSVFDANAPPHGWIQKEGAFMGRLSTNLSSLEHSMQSAHLRQLTLRESDSQ